MDSTEHVWPQRFYGETQQMYDDRVRARFANNYGLYKDLTRASMKHTEECCRFDACKEALNDNNA